MANDYKIESVEWRRPGVMEVQVVALIECGATVPKPPEASAYLKGFTGKLIETRVERIATADRVTWKFRGGVPPSKIGASKYNDSTDHYWSMDVALMQIPITVHPKLDAILKAGSGFLNKGDVEWPRYVAGKKNKWYGISSYLFPTVVVTRDSVRESGGDISFTEIDGVGFSEGGIKSGFNFSESVGAGRKAWLLESHTMTKVGNELRERKTWRWGGVRGWADQLYDKDWSA
jgi:hypothetical protein